MSATMSPTTITRSLVRDIAKPEHASEPLVTSELCAHEVLTVDQAPQDYAHHMNEDRGEGRVGKDAMPIGWTDDASEGSHRQKPKHCEDDIPTAGTMSDIAGVLAEAQQEMQLRPNSHENISKSGGLQVVCNLGASRMSAERTAIV